MNNLLTRVVHDRSGAKAIEYVLIGVLLLFVLLGAVKAVSTAPSTVVDPVPTYSVP